MLWRVAVPRVLLVSAIGLVHARARADPAVLVQGKGATCPTADSVQREIREFTVEPRNGELHFRLEISRSENGSQLDLYEESGERQFTRTIESQDCEALARAFALILRAHFVDLGIVERTPSGAPLEVKGRHTAQVKPAPVANGVSRAPERPWMPRWGMLAGIGIGGSLDLPDTSRSLAAAAHVGALAPDGLWLGLHLHGASRVRVGQAPDTVERWSAGIEAGVSYRLGRRWWLEPGASAGVVANRVQAVDADAEPRVSASPTVRATLRGGRAFHGLSWWLALGCRVVLDRDRYLIEPRGAIGLGPRASLTLLVGVDFR